MSASPLLDVAKPLPEAGVGEADVLLRVRGTVQGVGYRPFVRRAATSLQLRGWVRNDEQGVLIRAAGPAGAVAAFAQALAAEAPPAAHVDLVEALAPDAGSAPAGSDFSIGPSPAPGAVVATAMPPDLALCPDCRRELFDPADRRYRYPFINCTQCGPRYSILERLPYDRPRTTMRVFPMCPQCGAEYEDPMDRRFHAQPNACPVCGPHAWLTLDTGEQVEGEAALSGAVALLLAGGILAIKGIGGYHLMVDAGSASGVTELRRRKHREEKPFAVMFPDLAAIRAAAYVTPAAEALLTSAAAPVVILLRRPEAGLDPAVAPGNPWIGAVLPYSPLHALILAELGRPVVATSANLAEEPLCYAVHDAHRRLAGIADAFLEHNRPIAHPVDDSVVRLAATGPVRLRRARGYAPSPLRLPADVSGAWLCTGAQMKNTVATATGCQVVLSPHLGDLDGPATRSVFRRTAEILAELAGTPFTAVACDQHPDYASTRYAEETGLPRLAVQHHLAHVLACLLEHRHPADDVLGVVWDGTGYGEDGTIWGGEFLLLEKNLASRYGRLRPFRLPGGEAAIRDGRRTGFALARAAGESNLEALAASLQFGPVAPTLERMLAQGINSPVTSSAGRLFDGVGALLGLSARNSFEGQTPLAVEACAADSRRPIALPLPLCAVAPGSGAVCELDWQPLVAALRQAHAAGAPRADLAAGFHRALADGIVAVARQAGARTVALSGGCFQNTLLVDLTHTALHAAGFNVLLHRELPPNDGNISAGQALAALLGLATVRLP